MTLTYIAAVAHWRTRVHHRRSGPLVEAREVATVLFGSAMPQMGQSRRFGDDDVTSASPPKLAVNADMAGRQFSTNNSAQPRSSGGEIRECKGRATRAGLTASA